MMHLYSAGRAAPLAARLAEVLIDERLDPMQAEWLAVPSDGMRRWLILELARHLGASVPGGGDGIAANFVRAYPGTLRSCVLNAERVDPRADPWGIDRLVWSVLSVAERHRDDPGLAELVILPQGASRFAKARRVADLFDRYHLHRPDMIRAWADNRYVDGAGQPIADHQAWQPRLWRLVRDEVGEASPPERIGSLIERHQAESDAGTRIFLRQLIEMHATNLSVESENMRIVGDLCGTLDQTLQGVSDHDDFPARKDLDGESYLQVT